MPLIDLTLPLNSAPASHPLAGDARLVNCYADPQGDASKSGWMLTVADGLSSFVTLAATGIRAMMAITESHLLAVSGRVAYRVDTEGYVTELGGIPSDDHVSMALNNVGEVAIVSGGLYFSFVNGILTPISDPDLAPPVSVCIIGGYFVFMIADGRMFASELNDLDVTAISYATTEQSPDKGRVAWVRGDDLLAGGTRSIEVWAVTGDEGFPFRKVTMVIDPLTQQTIGVLSSAAARDGLFVASDKTVRILDGYTAVPVSTPAVNRAIAGDANPQSIAITSWSANGHTFYAVSGTDWTWVYDTTTKFWHERKSLDNGVLSKWRVSHVMPWGNRIVAGDRTTGHIYTMSNTIYDENGAEIVAQVHTAPVHKFPYRLRHHTLFVDAATGVGTEAETNPQIMIDWSDNGAPFGTQRQRDLGSDAQTLKKIRIDQLGSAFTRTYRFGASSNVRRLFIGAKLDADQMGLT